MEASTTSSYNPYELVAKYISHNYLIELIKPLNEVNKNRIIQFK